MAAASCGGGTGTGASDATLPEFPTTISTSPPLLTEGHAEKAAPRWEQVANFEGAAPLQTPQFAIAEGAIQWRVRAHCIEGRLRVDSVPPPAIPRPMVDASCPGETDGFSIVTGQHRLAVEASAPWRLVVEQQVDTPIDEPPLPEMATAPVVAEGSFYGVEKTGGGTVRVYRLPTGQHALRFSEDFRVFNDTDLVVWLSEAEAPRTSEAVVSRPHVEIAPLKSTRGPQNYLVPPGVPIERIRSVALWCVPVPSVYTAAALQRP
ncbi:MAG TPA: DM13 domain-containing protein [Acidimicrobiales bacterium]|nr:DM13 domain-containing protein [Acidimicrobiales bacterium]